MGSKLYVGNLSYNVTSSDLEQLCSQHGSVSSAEVIQDRDSGRSKGFGFVQMGTDQEAQAAISAMNGQEYDGRVVRTVVRGRAVAPGVPDHSWGRMLRREAA